MSHHFDIIRKEQRQCFEGIWGVVHEKDKQEWAYHGALRNTSVHWNGPECSSPTCNLETRPERYTSIQCTKTEGLHFGQKESVVDGVKGLGKIKVDNINCVTLVHHAHHRFLKDQQIRETGPTG